MPNNELVLFAGSLVDADIAVGVTPMFDSVFTDVLYALRFNCALVVSVVS